MFRRLCRVADAMVGVPFAIVADVLTFGGTCANRTRTFTGDQVRRVYDEATTPDSTEGE